MKQNAVSIQTSDDDSGKVSNARPDASPPPLPDDCDLSPDRFTFASPALESKATDEESPLSTPIESEAGVRRRMRTRNSRWNVRSTSWLSSIALHVAVLLLLFLILAPADFGGTGMTSFFITLSEEVHQDEITFLESTLADAGSDSTPANDTSSVSNSFPSELLGSRLGALLEGGATPGQSGSASGSFFGIEAGGHQFVYVLDMSNSMKGRRFDRATAELVRSVEQLGPHQEFYVLLFSNGTTQMFGRSESLPKPIAATMENKKRMADWLPKAFRGGGTDPREALRIAMRLNPSAIFMLSDGEFNGHKNQKRENLLGGNADAFSIVQAAFSKTPIHSIAFEDRSSRDNMKRLAEMTKGEFRFVPLEDGIDPAVSLKKARSAMQEGASASAELFLHQAVVNLEWDEGDDARKTKVEVGEVLLEFARNGLKKGELHTVRTALSEIVEMDEKASVTDEAQTWLVETLLKSLQDKKYQKDAIETSTFLSQLSRNSRGSTAAKKIRAPLAQVHLDKARQSYGEREFVQAIQNLEIVMNTLTETSAFQECQAEHDRIGDAMIQQAQSLRKKKGDVASAQYLRQLVVDVADTLLIHKVTQTLEEQAKEMLVAARDARIIRDYRTLKNIQQNLKEGFGEDPLLQRVQKEIALDERRAQAIMRNAVQLERSSRIAAMGKYRALIQNYSGTIAAQSAEQRLRVLGWR